MRTIWKFPLLDLTERMSFHMTVGAKPLCVQLQRGVPTLWAEIDDMAAGVLRDFQVVGTGHEFDHAGTYVATFQLHGGDLVLHLYDLGEHRADLGSGQPVVPT